MLWQLCLLPVLAAVGVVAYLPERPGRRLRDCAFFGSVLLAIVLGVLPSLSKDYLSVDETSFVADARKLAFDPVFYRSVDAGSTGPLNIYVLTVPAWFGGPITYVSARLTGAVLMFGLIATLYVCCAGFLGKRSARLVVLPLLGLVVLSTHVDFLHYSSERLSVFLTGLSLALLSRQFLGSGRCANTRMFALGVMTAAMCFSKLQAAPIALVLAVAALLHALVTSRARWQAAACLALGASGVPVAFGALFLYNGVFDEFWLSYVAWNLAYSGLNNASLATKILATVWTFLVQSEFRWYQLGVVCWLAISLGRQRHWGSAPPTSPRGLETVSVLHRWSWHQTFEKATAPVVFVLVLLSASIYAVAKPGNPFEHYLQFLMAPWVLCIAVGMSWAWKTEAPAASRRLFALLACALPAVLGIATEQTTSYEYVPQYDANSSPLVRLAKAYASEGESLGLWGWRSELYVESNMLPSTRFDNTSLQIEPTPRVEFFRQQYLRDFVAANPPLFFDAVGASEFSCPPHGCSSGWHGGWHGARRYTDRSRAGHETFPELARIIQARYTLVADVDGVRVYLRRDRWRCCPRL